MFWKLTRNSFLLGSNVVTDWTTDEIVPGFQVDLLDTL